MIEGGGEGAGFCFVSAGELSAEPEHCDDWVNMVPAPSNHPCDGVYLVLTINYDLRLDNDPIKVIKVITAHQVHSWQPRAEEGI